VIAFVGSARPPDLTDPTDLVRYLREFTGGRAPSNDGSSRSAAPSALALHLGGCPVLETHIPIEQAAFGLLRADYGAKPEFTRVLIRAGEAAVAPLVVSLVAWLREHEEDNRYLRDGFSAGRLGPVVGLSFVGRTMLEGHVESAFRIIDLVDEPGFGALLSLLHHADPDVALVAALLLGMPERPTDAFRLELVDHYVELLDKASDHTLLLLVIAMASAGDRWADGEVERMVRLFEHGRDTTIRAARAEAVLSIGARR
jgi:hypothetical protein